MNYFLPLSSLTEILPACILAGFGMICAGTYLDWMKGNQTMFDSRLLAVIPPLIGLKGNLEVTLSSRLSTMANIKFKYQDFIKLFFTTLAFILVQAIFAGIVISVLAVVLFLPTQSVTLTSSAKHLTVVSILTCTCSICMLSLLVCGLVYFCTVIGIDPDNIAPPMAAALGDLATVTLLFIVDEQCKSYPQASIYLAIVVVMFILVVGSLYLMRQCRPKSSLQLDGLAITWSTLFSSVGPLFCAIVLSSLSGQLLAHFSGRIPNLTRLQIAINGVGGCFGSILISRMTTRLHLNRKRATSPVFMRRPHSPDDVGNSLDESRSSSIGEVETDADNTFRLILLVCVPVHFILALASIVLEQLIESRPITIVVQPSTVLAYLLAGLIQVFAVLCFAKWVVIAYWHRLTHETSTETDRNPRSIASLDLAAIALTTGFGDLMGAVCLTTTLSLFHSSTFT